VSRCTKLNADDLLLDRRARHVQAAQPIFGCRRRRGGCIRAALTIERQQCLRDPRFDFRFTVEMRNKAPNDLAHVNMDIGLHRNIDVAAIWPASRARLSSV